MIPVGWTPPRRTPRYDEFPWGKDVGSIHELTDPSNECPHGCLPFDRNKPEGCRCWFVGWRPPAEVVPIRRRQERRYHKLTEGEVAEIRRLYAAGVSQGRLGVRFGVTKSAIGRIVRGETWRRAA